MRSAQRLSGLGHIRARVVHRRREPSLAYLPDASMGAWRGYHAITGDQLRQEVVVCRASSGGVARNVQPARKTPDHSNADKEIEGWPGQLW